MKRFHQNRRRLLRDRVTDGLILISAAPEIARNGDVTHFYRQDSYFLYLTGITKPDHALVIDPKRKRAHLFIPDISDYHRVWVGRQLTVAGAKKIYGVERCHYRSEFAAVMQKLQAGYKKIHILPRDAAALKQLSRAIKADKKTLIATLDKMRLYKTAEEVAALKRANTVSRDGHIAAMRAAKVGRYEYQVQAALEAAFLHRGAFHKAYHSIVAGGKSAAILHYNDNNNALNRGDFLLVDAGCEVDGYASDVTRTYPVSGKFSAKQKQIYDIVLAAQKKCIAAIRPGVTMAGIHELSGKTMLHGLTRLGLVKGDVDTLYAHEVHRLFYPHGVGHLLGLDVHDVGTRPRKGKISKPLRNSLKLEPDMVITVEPGLYFIEAYLDNAKVKKKYAQFVDWKKVESYRSVGGIRIEDDVLVTRTGRLNLTSTPKEVKEIERIMSV